MSLTPKNSFAILADAETLEIVNHTNKDHYLKQKKGGGGGGQKKEQVSRWYENYKQRQEAEQASKQKQQQQPKKSGFVVLGHGNNTENRDYTKGAVESPPSPPSLVKISQQGKASSGSTANAKFSYGGGDRQVKITAQGSSSSKPFRIGGDYSEANSSSGSGDDEALSHYGKALKNDNGGTVVEEEKIEKRPTFRFDDVAEFPGLGRTH